MSMREARAVCGSSNDLLGVSAQDASIWRVSECNQESMHWGVAAS
jgi:hypothetical protein